MVARVHSQVRTFKICGGQSGNGDRFSLSVCNIIMSTSVCPASCHSADYFIFINDPIIDAVLILTALLNNKLNKKCVLCIHINVVPNGLKIVM
jgi:hypothetical protein